MAGTRTIHNRRRSGVAWTDDDDTQLARLYEIEHRDWDSVAHALGRTVGACQQEWSKVVARRKERDGDEELVVNKRQKNTRSSLTVRRGRGSGDLVGETSLVRKQQQPLVVVEKELEEEHVAEEESLDVLPLADSYWTSHDISVAEKFLRDGKSAGEVQAMFPEKDESVIPQIVMRVNTGGAGTAAPRQEIDLTSMTSFNHFAEPADNNISSTRRGSYTAPYPTDASVSPQVDGADDSGPPSAAQVLPVRNVTSTYGIQATPTSNIGLGITFPTDNPRKKAKKMGKDNQMPVAPETTPSGTTRAPNIPRLVPPHYNRAGLQFSISPPGFRAGLQEVGRHAPELAASHGLAPRPSAMTATRHQVPFDHIIQHRLSTQALQHGGSQLQAQRPAQIGRPLYQLPGPSITSGSCSRFSQQYEGLRYRLRQTNDPQVQWSIRSKMVELQRFALQLSSQKGGMSFDANLALGGPVREMQYPPHEPVQRSMQHQPEMQRLVELRNLEAQTFVPQTTADAYFMRQVGLQTPPYISHDRRMPSQPRSLPPGQLEHIRDAMQISSALSHNLHGSDPQIVRSDARGTAQMSPSTRVRSKSPASKANLQTYQTNAKALTSHQTIDQSSKGPSQTANPPRPPITPLSTTSPTFPAFPLPADSVISTRRSLAYPKSSPSPDKQSSGYGPETMTQDNAPDMKPRPSEIIDLSSDDEETVARRKVVAEKEEKLRQARRQKDKELDAQLAELMGEKGDDTA